MLDLREQTQLRARAGGLNLLPPDRDSSTLTA